MLAEHVGVDPQCHGRICVAEPRGHYVYRDPGQEQGGRMQVAKIMQACVRQRLSCRDRLVVLGDHLGHESGHGVGVEGFAPPADEDEIAAVCPGRSGGQLVVGLTVQVFSQDGRSLAVNADYSGPSALGGSLNPLAADNGS
jgi:hypothetical protein